MWRGAGTSSLAPRLDGLLDIYIEKHLTNTCINHVLLTIKTFKHFHTPTLSTHSKWPPFVHHHIGLAPARSERRTLGQGSGHRHHTGRWRRTLHEAQARAAQREIT